MAKLGLIRLMRRRGQKMTGVKLTDKGETIAADATAMSALDECGPILDRLYELRTSPDGFDHHGYAWAREDRLCGSSDEHPRRRLAYDILPALVHDLAAVNSDARGVLWYGLPLNRLDRLPSLTLPPNHRRKKWTAEPIDELADLYVATRIAEQDHLESAPLIEPRNISPVPLSCSPVTRQYVDLPPG